MSQFQSIITRFIKGAVFSGASAVAVVSYATPTAWSDFPHILNTLGIVFIGGALSGFLLALEKWATWDPAQYL